MLPIVKLSVLESWENSYLRNHKTRFCTNGHSSVILREILLSGKLKP